jgi:putative intracellular protease/amidase
MSTHPLKGKRIAVLLETEFIPEELDYYETRFAELGAEVHFMARLWNNPAVTFVSDVDDIAKRVRYREVTHDLMKADVRDYDVVLVAANYPSLRLRYFDTPNGAEHKKALLVRTAPAVEFFARAMLSPTIVKGALCHGLLLLSPRPDLLRGRRVICHEVVMADVVNCGAVVVHSDTGVVVDGVLVTGRSADDVEQYVDAITRLVGTLGSGMSSPSHEEAARTARDGQQRVLIVLSSFGFWGEELLKPMQKLEEAGIGFDFATPYGHPPKAVSVSLDPDYVDPPLGRTITTQETAEAVRALIDSGVLGNVKSVEDCVLDDYDGVLLVGGSGPVMDMNNCRALHELLRQFDAARKPIAAECYAVGALIYTRKRASDDPQEHSILWGRKVTGHPLAHDYTTGYGYENVQSEYSFIGPALPLQYALQDAVGPEGEFIGNLDRLTSVVTDEHIITSRSVASSEECGERLVALLKQRR